MTLTQLRALLKRTLHADGPTPPHISRLGQSVTVEDLVRAYLPRRIEMMNPEAVAARRGYGEWRAAWTMTGLLTLVVPDSGSWRLDLTDPGTVQAVKVALALARGFDPSNGVKWTRNGADNAWVLDASDWCVFATSTAARSVTPSRHVIEADLVGNETDSTRALMLAVEHVLAAT